MAKQAHVRVPTANDVLTHGEFSYIWDDVGKLVTRAKSLTNNDEIAYSIVISRVTREVRRSHGAVAAKEMLQGLIDTIMETSMYDKD